MVAESSESIIHQLKELSQKHRVCYEVWPETLMVKGQKTKVGFELELYGTHAHGETKLLPGCSICVETFRDLRKIAGWIIPKEERDSYYDIEPFDHAIRERPSHNLRPEVVLKIKILHKHGFDKPVDSCEERCLKEMREKLAELGVWQGEWKSTGQAAQESLNLIP